MHVHDPLVKIQCQSCHEEYLVSEYILKQIRPLDEDFIIGDGCYCPYCGSQNTEAIVGPSNNLDYAEEMGCLAISHTEIGEGEELKPWRVIKEETSESIVVEAIDSLHAFDVARRQGFLGVGSYTSWPVEAETEG